MATKLSSEEVADLWRVYKEDQAAGRKDERLRNKLIETYYPLVRYNAERVWAKLPEGVDLNDLISAGVFGLMDAIDAFDLERGVNPGKVPTASPVSGERCPMNCVR
ncbi:MAG: sigma factor [Planctomycetaceae bacterium]